MLFRQIYDDSLAQAAYLIGCQRTGEAIVFDPERDIDRYIELARKEGLRIVAVSETHIHADFLSGSREFAETMGTRTYLSDAGPADWKYNWTQAYDVQFVNHGDRFKVGLIEFEVVHTPGHTPEHVSFLVTDRGGGADEPMGILTGDFVFVGDLGRPDLLETAAGASNVKEPAARALAKSAQEFLSLEEWLQVWPAHGAGSACGKALGAVPQSTVGYERRHNPALVASANEDQFVNFILSGQPSPPLYFARMKSQNRDGVPLLGALPSPSRMRMSDLDENVVVVDTRPPAEFASGHRAGSIAAPLGQQLLVSAGSYVNPAEEIVLVVEAAALDDAVRSLVRIGLDRVVGWVDASDLVGTELVEQPSIDVDELETRRAAGEFVLDVRRSDEFLAGHIEGARHVPHTRVETALNELPKDQPVLVYCRSGVRSAMAVAALRRWGVDAVDVRGGITAWQKSGRPAPKPESADVGL